MTPSAVVLNEALEASQSTKSKEKTPLEAISHGDVLPDIPTFPTFKEHRRHMLTHMAATFRYFARQNYIEGQSGHISVRDPEFPNLMWMNPLSRHFGMLMAGDMICIDISSGEIIGGTPNPTTGGRTVNMAGYYIHSAVHLRRPDIHAICHAHGVSGRAWSVFGRPLDMLTQDVCNFYGILAVYDAYDGIVFGPQEGINIAEALGSNKKAAILMNHGLLTCGETVDEAGFMFGLLERSCEIQLQAEAAAANGIPKKMITDEEAAYNFKMASEKNALYREAQPDIEFEFFLAGGEEVLERGFDKLALLNGVNSTS